MEKHGSPYDRGSADSYYMRAKRPHKMIGLIRIDDLTDKERKEYDQGYEDNEAEDHHKEWD